MNDINVHIGQVKVGKGETVLHAILGSCVGIGMIWREGNVCALAHCFLPESKKIVRKIEGRHVNQAIYSLLRAMKVPEERYREVRVVVAGGAQINTEKLHNDKDIGQLNVEAVHKFTREKRLRILEESMGGTLGKKITLYCHNYTYEITDIPRINHG